MRRRTSTRFLHGLVSVIIAVVITASLLTNCAYRKSTRLRIINPYANVDWVTHGQYKANFHTHTTIGDAAATPQEVIDQYLEAGYSILALTDHDTNGPEEPTWPWQAYDRSPDSLGMVAIQGNEISEENHIGSHFNDYGNPDIQSEEEAIKEIGQRGGLALLHHPGRYDRTLEWYLDLYRRYDHLIGQEVYNQIDRYPGDRAKWDSILTVLLPERPVWAFSNDDMHNPEKNLGFSWNVIIAPELTSDLVRQAMEEGCFFFVHAPKGYDEMTVPVIDAIIVKRRPGSLRIKASDYEFIEWVSQGEIVHRGDRLNLADLPDTNKYIRAEVFSADSVVVGTQPFLILRPEPKE
ncbi:MAG: hypothetical protein JSU77_04475 [Fidelibacterota bacterium]|nr:MAG: hypothetical protein JSU77_04475 [Candidatus Neomarinimicrobiota bacterium]